MRAKHHLTSIIAFIVIAAFLGGCHKDASVIVTHTSKVKSESTTSPSGIPYTVTYTYDSSGRQVVSQTDTVVTTYVYGPDTITKTIDLANHFYVTKYAVNAAGMILSDSKFYVYNYDNNGYLSTLSYTGNGNYDSTVYTISGGNVMSAVLHQVDSGTNNLVTTTYTYMSNTDSRNYGMSCMGKQNNNLISTQTVTQVINGSTYSESYTYTYSFDSQGRVTQQVRSSGTAMYTTTYTYY